MTPFNHHIQYMNDQKKKNIDVYIYMHNTFYVTEVLQVNHNVNDITVAGHKWGILHDATAKQNFRCLPPMFTTPKKI